MLASVKWINQYLDPSDLTADEAVDVLERTSFPIEEREDLAGGDARIDVELTSNRGDAFSHLTLAREIAAVTGRRVVEPEAWAEPPGVARVDRLGETTITVETPEACPRFTARAIRGVEVGPSPAWLREALEAVGQRSINNVVDVSNYVLFELGHPSHAFDLDRLLERRLVIRWAREGEQIASLDGHIHKLLTSDLVVADAERVVSLAGVVGGTDSGVSEQTVDVLLEVATWDPITIRNTARRLHIFTDAGYRFERTVDPRDVARASARATELILQVAGGTVDDGMIDAAQPVREREVIELRPQRCKGLLGVEISADDMARHLSSIAFEVEPKGDVLRVGVPHNRAHEVTREVDLIEEVGRIHGIDNIPVAETLPVRFDFDHPPSWQQREGALDAIGSVLTGLGYFETVTFSFLAEDDARAFLPKGLELVRIDEERRREAPWLRPSAIPSLLTCRKANRDGGVEQPGGIRLFEIASVFAEVEGGRRETVEHMNLSLLADLPEGGKGSEREQAGLRAVRGAIEAMADRLGGPGTAVELRPIDPITPAYEGGTCAQVLIDGEHAGVMGILPRTYTSKWDLDEPIAVAELGVAALIKLYPPKTSAHALPRFPPIDRDLSLIVGEGVAWGEVRAVIDAVDPAHLEGVTFVGAYRGKQVGEGRKSLTLRMRFRDASGTLRGEAADEAVERVVARLRDDLKAELRQ